MTEPEESPKTNPRIFKGKYEDRSRRGNKGDRPIVLKAHGVPRDRCPVCGNTVSVLSWASKCTCE